MGLPPGAPLLRQRDAPRIARVKALGTRLGSFEEGYKLVPNKYWILLCFVLSTETLRGAYLLPLIFSLGVDSGIVSGRLAAIEILRIFFIGTPRFLKRASS